VCAKHRIGWEDGTRETPHIIFFSPSINLIQILCLCLLCLYLGEDIALSENEDDEEGNELIYDEFFCRDDEVCYSVDEAEDISAPVEGDAGKPRRECVKHSALWMLSILQIDPII
jgi:hypothetical protein